MTGRRRGVPRGRSLVGERFSVDVGNVAHGGHCVARHEGRVIFVRHTLPGERVVVEVTEGDERSRFLRGDAVEVLSASPDRVEPPCPFSGPGRCGGCDFQHVALPAQRDLKGFVVREQLQRLARIDRDVTVEAVPGDDAGLGWRTRVQYAVDASGRAGLRKHRSHELVHVDACPIAHPDLPPVTSQRWPQVDSVEAIRSGTGERLRIATTEGELSFDGPQVLHEPVGERVFRVSGSGFWQVHPGAAATLVGAVLDGAAPQPGETAVDLYAGVGLFTAALAEAVGPTGRVLSVESGEAAVGDAARNLADLPQVDALRDRVDRALRRGRLGERADVVVLDPPRSGAGREVVEGVVALRPRVVVYVACDPAALARDLATFGDLGYRLDGLRGFDLFPMTHHVECVAVLRR